MKIRLNKNPFEIILRSKWANGIRRKKSARSRP
jgi:hypothetical protein